MSARCVGIPRALARLALFLATGLVGAVAAPVAVPALDWSAPHRWVHLDNVTQAGVGLFEGARRRWLAALRKDGTALPDGRPLFWSGDHDGLRTYVTFWPFGEMAALDARSRMVAASQAKLTPQALKEYQDGDAALVAPHYTQIWSRQPEDDFVSPVAGDLTELSGAHGRLQLLQLNLQVAARADANWGEIRALLARKRYPLTCRVFSSRYGAGQTILLWLSTDAVSLKSAPGLTEFLQTATGESQSTALAKEFAGLWSAQQQLDVVRRDDLSNLP